MLLHDLSPQPPPPAPPAPWFPDRPPRRLPMLARGVANSMTASLGMAGPIGRAIGRAAPAAIELMGEWLLPSRHLPVTRFNSIVSPHRVFETRRFLLEEFKAIRKLVGGATVNDAVLAVCGGGLRRYLQGHGELPAASLVAMAPFYVRDPGAPADAPPQLSWTRVELGTDLADPVARLARVHEQTSSSEVVARALGARELTEAGHHMPASTLALTGKWLGRATSGLGRYSPLAHCTITNVPGPKVPLYLCGARMTYFSAIMPISDGNGLVFAVTSYDDRIVISPTSCRELMPDPAVFAQCVRDSFQELLALATGNPAIGPRPAPGAPEADEPEAAPPRKRPPRARASRAGAAARSAPPRASTSGRRSPTSPPG
jgi:WS/DGAT/MGAT family acyltransferase